MGRSLLDEFLFIAISSFIQQSSDIECYFWEALH